MTSNESARGYSVTGRYVHLTIQGTEYRVYFEEAGAGIPILRRRAIALRISREKHHSLGGPPIDRCAHDGGAIKRELFVCRAKCLICRMN